MLLLLHLSVNSFLCKLDQDSHLFGSRAEVVALLSKEEEQGEGEEEGEDNREKKKKKGKKKSGYFLYRIFESSSR